MPVDFRTRAWVVNLLRNQSLEYIDVDTLVAGTVTITTLTATTGTIANLTVGTNLDLNGSLNLDVVTKTANYTAADETVILCDATSNAITITLPTAVGNMGRIYHIKKIDASANTVTVSGTIDSGINAVLTDQYESISPVSDNVEWWII